VTIVARSSSCPAVATCGERRLLPGEAPRLPLPQCDRAASCRCIFKHHADRRAGPRREEEANSMMKKAKPTANRRTSRGRRATDHG
jgi:hypothetical protein